MREGYHLHRELVWKRKKCKLANVIDIDNKKEWTKNISLGTPEDALIGEEREPEIVILCKL